MFSHCVSDNSKRRGLIMDSGSTSHLFCGKDFFLGSKVLKISCECNSNVSYGNGFFAIFT